MKKFSIITTVIVPLTLFSGCMKNEIINDETGAMEIQFNAENKTSTRAAIGSEGFPVGSAFSVWGFMTKDSQTANVFEGNIVTKGTDNSWTCDATRYWFSGWNYDFYAIHPSGIGSVSNDGVVTVEKFDCSTTGADAKDLMISSAPGLSYVPEDGPQPVTLNFNHLLSRIDFVGKSVGGSAIVHSVVLSGINTTANCSASFTQEGNVNATWTGPTSGSVSSKIDGGVKLEQLSTTSVVEDMLIIPQTLTDAAKVTITYSTDAEQNKIAEYNLIIGELNIWEAGKSYRYSFEVTGGGYIIFNKPTVNTWNSATGGNVIIDVTQ